MLSAERTVLERARVALARGRSADALAALREHRRRFRRGSLSEEREALSVVALINLGQWDRARARARNFRRRHPRSMLLPVVEGAMRKLP